MKLFATEDSGVNGKRYPELQRLTRSWQLHSPVLTVSEVLDGDTIRVGDGSGNSVTVRYLGVDTPETVHPSKPVQCFGPEASRRNHLWAENRRVILKFDRQRVDAYGRVLAAVKPIGWSRSISERLASEGLARVLTIKPNGSTAKKLTALEMRAKGARRGLWRYCPNGLRCMQ